MKKRICTLLLLCLTLLFSLPVSANRSAITFHLNEEGDTLYASDGRTYERIDTYQFGVEIGEQLTSYDDSSYIFCVVGSPNDCLLWVGDEYSDGLFCDVRYIDRITEQMVNFTPADSYGIIDSCYTDSPADSLCLYLPPIDTALIEALNRSAEKRILDYDTLWDADFGTRVCVRSEDGVFFTTVGMIVEVDGSQYYVDYRYIDGVDFRYNGQPKLDSLGVVIYATELTEAQSAQINTCIDTYTEWENDFYDTMYGSSDLFEDSYFGNILLLIMGILLCGVAPLAGLVCSILVFHRSRRYRPFAIVLFVLCILILTAFCLLLMTLW